jgi:hypothetical protein
MSTRASEFNVTEYLSLPLTKALQRRRTLGRHVPPSLKLIARCALVAVALVAAFARPAPAAAATPCWKALLNDWYDGRIDKTYAVHCYNDALKHLPADVQTYSSAHDDIQRALQSALAKQRKAGHKVTRNSIVPPASGGGSGSGGGGGSAGGGGGGTSTTPGGTGTTATTGSGRNSGKGLSHLANKLNPASASSLPIPLLVLGALAILLVAAGAAGVVVKQIQARKQAP